MNAEAHLRAQGWQGPGTGLRTGSLQRAILTSKKTDLKGLGAKAKESDQWWDNIFSKQLSNITVGASGEIGQINGGIKAAHPVAARNAHRRQFGEKSALEKVFRMSEVLKGSECFIPLAPAMAQVAASEGSPTISSSPKKRKSKGGEKEDKALKKSKKERKIPKTGDASKIAQSSKKSRLQIDSVLDSTLPSPPPSPQHSQVASKDTVDGLQVLSDGQIRKEARRLRKETKVLEKAQKAARKEHRRLRKLQKSVIVT